MEPRQAPQKLFGALQGPKNVSWSTEKGFAKHIQRHPILPKQAETTAADSIHSLADVSVGMVWGLLRGPQGFQGALARPGYCWDGLEQDVGSGRNATRPTGHLAPEVEVSKPQNNAKSCYTHSHSPMFELFGALHGPNKNHKRVHLNPWDHKTQDPLQSNSITQVALQTRSSLSL